MVEESCSSMGVVVSGLVVVEICRGKEVVVGTCRGREVVVETCRGREVVVREVVETCNSMGVVESE